MTPIVYDPKSDEIVDLTYAQAKAMLPDGDTIHTIRNVSMALIGADWSRKELLKAIKTGSPQIAGEQAASTGHYLVINTNTEDTPHYLWIETKPPRLAWW